jgi:hypothetical protein
VVSVRPCLILSLLANVVLGACGSDSGTAGGSGTDLEVDGVATSALALPTPDDPKPMPDPSDAAQIPFAGTLTCAGTRSHGTGIFAVNPVDVCLSVGTNRAVFDAVGSSDDRACAQVYGGPQHATIKGTVGGQRVDVKVERTDGCGIEDWERLEWLLGPPER